MRSLASRLLVTGTATVSGFMAGYHARMGIGDTLARDWPNAAFGGVLTLAFAYLVLSCLRLHDDIWGPTA